LSPHQPDCTESQQKGLRTNQTAARDGLRANGVAWPRGIERRSKMSMTPLTIFRPATARRSGASFRRLLDGLAHEIVRYFVCRSAIKTLGELSDHELRDIGLVRSQIAAAVHGAMPRRDRSRN
jgi:uncharacterized protein YjiS (DUF1127 family)